MHKYVVITICAAVLGAPLAYGLESPEQNPLTITAPGNNDVVAGRNTEFRGTAPKNTLINITVVDTDTGNIFNEHQKTGRVNGSTTSDANGDWVFVPQQELVPGTFSVSATIANNSASIVSKEVVFSAVDETGRTSHLAMWVKYVLIGLSLLVLLVLAILLIRWWVRRRNEKESSATEEYYVEETDERSHRGYEHYGPHHHHYHDDYDDRLDREREYREAERTKEIEDEMIEVEHDIDAATRQLERTAEEVAALREKISGETEEEPVSKVVHKRRITKTKDR